MQVRSRSLEYHRKISEKQKKILNFLAVNSSRGNKYYGECGVTSAKCLKPANKEAALDTETDKDRWAPPKKVFILHIIINQM